MSSANSASGAGADAINSRNRSAEISRDFGGEITATAAPLRVTSISSPFATRLSSSEKLRAASVAVILVTTEEYQINLITLARAASPGGPGRSVGEKAHRIAGVGLERFAVRASKPTEGLKFDLVTGDRPGRDGAPMNESERPEDAPRARGPDRAPPPPHPRTHPPGRADRRGRATPGSHNARGKGAGAQNRERLQRLRDRRHKALARRGRSSLRPPHAHLTTTGRRLLRLCRLVDVRLQRVGGLPRDAEGQR